jgi:carbonic anhydrase
MPNYHEPQPNYHWQQQSPIDLSIQSSHYVDFGKSFLEIQYNGICRGKLEMKGGRYDFVVQDYATNAQTIKFNGTKATLKKIHLHTPSEHNLEGNNFGKNGGAIHLLHEFDEQEHGFTGYPLYLVLGVFFDLSKKSDKEQKQEQSGFNLFASRFVQSVKLLNECADDKVEPIEVSPWNLLPGGCSNNFPNHWFWYEGSLTSPPYSENVSWVCLKEPIETTSTADFQNIPHQHERGIQPLNRRFVLRNFK